jgi:hypothetical protein
MTTSQTKIDVTLDDVEGGHGVKQGDHSGLEEQEEWVGSVNMDAHKLCEWLRRKQGEESKKEEDLHPLGRHCWTIPL